MHSYDFAYNEIVNVMDCVPLETLSTSTGRKNYIAVATTVNRGEDLAAKGAVSAAHRPGLSTILHSFRHTSLKWWRSILIPPLDVLGHGSSACAAAMMPRAQ